MLSTNVGDHTQSETAGYTSVYQYYVLTKDWVVWCGCSTTYNTLPVTKVVYN